MALARCQLTIQDEDGNIVDGASVEVRNENTLLLPPVYSDRAGTFSLGNAFTAADGADAGFHVTGGVYKITATLGAFSRTWRYVGVGTASETDFTAGADRAIAIFDAGGVAASSATISAVGTLGINPTAGLNQGLVITQAGTGSPTGVSAFNRIDATDNWNASGADAVTAALLYLGHTVGGSSVKGSRGTIWVHQFVGADAAVSASNRDFIGIISQVDSSAAMPVTATAATLFAFSGLIELGAGASGFEGIVGAEIGVSNQSAGAVNYAIGWNVVGGLTQAANTRSVGYQLSGYGGNTGFGYGLLLTNQNGAHPLAAGTTIIGTIGSSTVAKGIDFSSYTISDAFLKGPNFVVKGSGKMHVGSSADPTRTLQVLTASDDGLLITDGTVSLLAFASGGPAGTIGTSSNHTLNLITNNTAKVGINGAGTVTLTAYGTGLLHSSSGGVLTSSAVVTADITAANVTNAKLADMVQNSIKGRITASTGVPEDLTAANVKTILGYPTASIDNVIVRFDGTAGGMQAGSLTTISDTGAMFIGTSTPVSVSEAFRLDGSASSLANYYDNVSFFFRQSTNTANNMATHDFRSANGNSAAAISCQFVSHTAGSAIGRLNFYTTNLAGAGVLWAVLNETGQWALSATTVSTSAASGSLVNAGGFGNAGEIWCGGNLNIATAAKTLSLKRGANGAVGTFVCNGTTPVTVNNTFIAITDTIIISLNTVGGTVGATPAVKTITAATGFTVAGTASDTSTYNYAIVKNAA